MYRTTKIFLSVIHSSYDKDKIWLHKMSKFNIWLIIHRLFKTTNLVGFTPANFSSSMNLNSFLCNNDDEYRITDCDLGYYQM